MFDRKPTKHGTERLPSTDSLARTHYGWMLQYLPQNIPNLNLGSSLVMREAVISSGLGERLDSSSYSQDLNVEVVDMASALVGSTLRALA